MARNDDIRLSNDEFNNKRGRMLNMNPIAMKSARYDSGDYYLSRFGGSEKHETSLCSLFFFSSKSAPNSSGQVLETDDK